MKAEFLIIGTFQQDIVNEVSLSSDGLTTDQSFGVLTTEQIGDSHETELDAIQELQKIETTKGFWESWDFVEVKKVFVKS